MEKTALTRAAAGRRLWLMTPALLTTLCLTTAHPQCVDSTPPGPSTSPLTLCSHYRSSSCCSPHQERDILDVFLSLQHRLSSVDWDRCERYIQELLCARCSPFSAHMFDGQSRRPLPGLCPDYCREFYSRCGDVTWFLDPALAASLRLHTHAEFCHNSTVSDMNYCFSGERQAAEKEEKEEGQAAASVSSEEGCVCLEPLVVSGLANPILARHAGDGSGRLFVGEQRGVVWAVDPVSRQRSDTPFLNVSSRLLLTSRYDERGLGGLAFHPRFSSNGRVFVYYNAPLTAGDLTEEERKVRRRWDHVSRLSELRVQEGAVVDPAWEKVLLEVHQPFANHNGGEVFFLGDGYLYLFLGDGGYAGDPYNLAQNKSWLLGKVLRLDVDTPSDHPDRPYSIPADNPFMEHPDPSARPEIFAYGLRNTWRCGVDMGDPYTGRGRDRVLCGDVGQAKYEEVDFLKKGANYGWSAREGFHCYKDNLCNHIGKEEMPVFAYNHTVGQSVTGGQFYRGPCSPALNGKYIFGDYQSGRLFSLQESDDGSWQSSDVKLCSSDLCSDGLTNDLQKYILSFGLDQRGEVYILTSNSSLPMTADGAVYRIVDPRSSKRWMYV
ncbi:HHIP-like protein 1 isoform X2 [Babylonia areolata]|uniref:HHIP-like protein 1 isoform X2 n=1 Tax=Babylonia areolata TaxID=304850 RepID=UPI003FCFB051